MKMNRLADCAFTQPLSPQNGVDEWHSLIAVQVDVRCDAAGQAALEISVEGRDGASH